MGKADLEGTQNALTLHDEVIKHVSAGIGPYIQIEDYAALNGSTQAARSYFINKMNMNERYSSLIFCNLSPSLSIAVKIGSRFITTGKPIHVTKHYSDALKQALKHCEQHNIKTDVNTLEPGLRLNRSERSLKPIHLLSDSTWDIQTPEFSNHSVIINKHIVHSKPKGYLESKHISLLDQKRNVYQAALPQGSTIDYMIVDSSELKGGSREARNQYMQSLKNWHRQSPFRAYILYGANPLMRTVTHLTGVFIPFKIKIAQDFNQAFEIIRQDKLNNATEKHQRQAEPAYIAPNQEDINNLLAYIGSINWELEGSSTQFDVPETHPFYTLFQSIKLIKEEVDSLFIERKKAAEALQKSNIQLQTALAELKQTQEKMVQQERLSAVGQLAAGIAHDFNNILGSILGFAKLMQMSPDTPAAMQSDLQKIIASSQRAAYLVRQLMDFSHNTINQPKQFDLVSFAQETVESLEHTIPDNIQITLNLEPGHYMIEADPTQLHEVIINLAINASDAMPNGGLLQIGISEVVCTGNIHCTLCDQPIMGEWIQLQVTDTGSGMPANILRHIFEPFFTTKDVGTGTGLGLSQVSGIVAQHQGHISVESQLEQGTTITIYLPACTSGATPSLT
jgi:signal transduction histidine kinase